MVRRTAKMTAKSLERSAGWWVVDMAEIARLMMSGEFVRNNQI